MNNGLIDALLEPVLGPNGEVKIPLIHLATTCSIVDITSSLDPSKNLYLVQLTLHHDNDRLGYGFLL